MADTAQTERPIETKRRWSWVTWIWVFFFLMILVDCFGAYVVPALQAWTFHRACEQTISWVRTSHPVPGVYRELALPERLRWLAADGMVGAVVLQDERIILLLKTMLGDREREARAGFIWCSAPLKPNEIGRDARGRNQIQIKGIEENYIETKIDDRHFRVVFDLD